MADRGAVGRFINGYKSIIKVSGSKYNVISGAINRGIVLAFRTTTFKAYGGIGPISLNDVAGTIFSNNIKSYLLTYALPVKIDGNEVIDIRVNLEFFNVVNRNKFNKTISGTVRDNEDNFLAGYPVGLYYKPNKKLVSITISDTNGMFTFSNLNDLSENYFAVCLDITSTYDGIVHDRLTPE